MSTPSSPIRGPVEAPRQIRTLKIDGFDVSGRAEQTILQVALEHEIDIPRLCHVEGLSAIGACRLCLVEIRATGRLVPACVTRIEEGMEVITDSKRIQKYRRSLLELLFAERNHICAVCVANGNCELQILAEELGMDHVRVPYLNPDVPVDASHKQLAVDHNRCILCTRCVRVCDEVEGAHTWDVEGRGVDARIITDMRQPWGDSGTCTNCGKCVELCPTGALFEKGTCVAELERREFLPYLTAMRRTEQ